MRNTNETQKKGLPLVLKTTNWEILVPLSMLPFRLMQITQKVCYYIAASTNEDKILFVGLAQSLVVG